MKWAYESVLQAIGVERELLKSLKNREKIAGTQCEGIVYTGQSSKGNKKGHWEEEELKKSYTTGQGRIQDFHLGGRFRWLCCLVRVSSAKSMSLASMFFGPHVRALDSLYRTVSTRICHIMKASI